MSCSFLLIPTKFPTLNSYSKHINSTALLGFSSFSCLRSRRRSNSIATSFSRGRSLGCKCQLADIAPVTSAAYGVILLGGGLFACKKKWKSHLFSFLALYFLTFVFLIKFAFLWMKSVNQEAKGRSLEGWQGLLSWERYVLLKF